MVKYSNVWLVWLQDGIASKQSTLCSAKVDTKHLWLPSIDAQSDWLATRAKRWPPPTTITWTCGVALATASGAAEAAVACTALPTISFASNPPFAAFALCSAAVDVDQFDLNKLWEMPPCAQSRTKVALFQWNMPRLTWYWQMGLVSKALWRQILLLGHCLIFFT